MKMTVNERIVAMRLLPEKGNVITLKVIMEAHDALGFSAADHKKFGIKTEQVEGGVQTTWDPKKDKPTEIKLSEPALEILREAIDKINGDEELTMQQLTLFEKLHVPELDPDKKK